MPPTLSVELWAHVFSFVQLNPRDVIDGGDTYRDCWNKFSKFQQLKLVCKLFNQVLCQQSSFASVLLLPLKPHRRIPSLLTWLQRFRGSVSVLTTDCHSRYAEAVLAGLACAASQFRYVSIRNASDSTASFLGAFTALTSCHLHGNVDLLPMDTLSHLLDLTLSCGTFHNLQAAAHLNSLTVGHAEVFSVGHGPFVKSLACIYLEEGICDFLGGIPACLELKTLTCIDGELISGNDEQLALKLRVAPFHTPAGMTALSRLEVLHLASQSRDSFDTSWTYQLTSLEHLTLQFFYLHFSNQPTMFSRLCKLTVSGCMASEEDPESLVTMNMPWSSMQSLQSLCLFDGSYFFASSLSELLHLKCFKTLAVRNCTPYNHHSKHELRAVLYKLGRYRPDIYVFDDGKCISDNMSPHGMSS